MRKSLFFFFIFFHLQYLYAQNSIGLPDVINYTNQIYAGGAQNWDIQQDENGILYFGNNEGLLSFDGSYWKIYPLPNKTVVRSIKIGPDNKIYVGGQNELGFYSPNKKGELFYTSLTYLLPVTDRSFADVWNIESYNGSIFFRTSNKIMRFYNDKFYVYPNADWRFLGSSNNQLIAQDHENKLFIYRNNSWVPFVNTAILTNDFLITSFIPYSIDTSLIITLKNGIFLLSNNSITKLSSDVINDVSNKNIYAALNINGNHLLLATSFGGFFIIDKKGNLIQKFSTKEGLQNNNVRHVLLDKSSNLWLALDNGIDFIAYNNSVKQIIPDKQNEGAGYAALIHNNTFYLGTTNGLYSLILDSSKNISLAKGVFTPVNNSQGQVWNLSEVNGELLMGHHEGAFLIKNNAAIPLDKSSGFWIFYPLYKEPSKIMLAGNYQGVNFYNYDNGKFINANITAHFESSRIIVVNNEDIWVAHPYKGIFKLNFNPPNNVIIQSYKNGKGLSSVNHFFIFKIKDRIVVPTEDGFFEYDPASDSFQPSVYFENIFGKIKINYLKQDKNGNIWFTSEKNLGVVDFSQKEPKIIYITELKGKFLRGFEFIYPIDINNILVGGEKGFYHINYEEYSKNNNQIKVLIRAVKAVNKNDSLIFGGYYSGIKQKQTELSYKLNSIIFEFSSVLYGQQSNIEYSYLLKGFDKNWSSWIKKTDKEYTNLPAGNYTFQVKARNNLGNESEICSYSFTILPPWYQTNWAYFIYILFFIIGNYILFIYLKRKFKNQQIKHNNEQKRLQYLHQLERERTDKEIVKLKNEKLEADLQYKNNELASVAMHLVQKGELLGKIKDQMQRFTKSMGNEKDEELKKIIHIIKDENKIDKQWEQFTIHFDNVHSNFHAILKNKYPDLSTNELKLSAYLRMNLTTKEIAQLMSISVRGVEISRYRLRKKLQLPTEVNLNDFFTKLTSD